MARSNLHEISEMEHSEAGTVHGTVTEQLAALDSVYPVAVATFTVADIAPFRAGHVLTELEARVMNSTRSQRAASSANSALTKGKQAKLTDTEKHAWLSDYMPNYTFTDEMGSDFSNSLLRQAADFVAWQEGSKQAPADFGREYDDSKSKMDWRAGLVDMILAFAPDKTAPDGETFASKIAAKAEAILAERHEIRTRVAATDKVSAAAKVSF